MSDLVERLRASLADRYSVDGEIGRGGTAIVFSAHDGKLGRTVAVKVLLPELAASLGSERFLREIEIAARLTHPNILPLFDCGESEGLLYYVMPFVEGGSLRSILLAKRSLKIEEALAIARPVAAALNHAHKQGVIHRDIKPENILFSQGEAVVADFGVAKAITTAGETGLTRSGIPIGTPGYMSSEQAGGKADLDARTDVCGLACVVYEMLVGETPGVWTTPEEVRLGRIEDIPANHRTILDRFPGRVEQVLARGLAIRPGERHHSTVDFAEALRSASSPSERIGDSEIREILERAASGESRIGADTGDSALTIGSVEQVGAQVGIAPEEIRRAASEVRSESDQSAPVTKRQSGSTSEYRKGRVVVDRTIAGEITPAAYELMVREINTHLGFVGNISTVGNSLHWAGTKPGFVGRDVRISLTTASGQTHVHIEEHIELRGASVLAPGWGVGGGVAVSVVIWASLGLPESALLSMAIPLGIVGAVSTAIGLTKGLANRYRPQLQELADSLEQIARRDLTSGDT